MRLYDVPQELDRLIRTYEELLIESQGEVTDAVVIAEEELKAYLRDSTDKIEAAVAVVQNLDSDASQLREEEKRLAERRRGLEVNSARLQGIVSHVLDVAFEGKIKTPKYTVWNQDYAGGMNVALANGVEADKAFKRNPALFNPPSLSKSAVKAYLESHKQPQWLVVEELPGKRGLRIR